MKKWVALLMVLLVGVGTLYAEFLNIDVDGDGKVDYSYSLERYFSMDITSDGIKITYDNVTETIEINKTSDKEIIINITTEWGGGGTSLFTKTLSANEHESFTIKKTNNGWVLIIPTKAPIPPIAIALTLMAIPIIALRKLKIAK